MNHQALSPKVLMALVLDLNPSEVAGCTIELVALEGIINVVGAVTMELLITTDKKLFSLAVYPTFANDVAKIAAFNETNNVDVVAGNVV
jgi:hypothetical protein